LVMKVTSRGLEDCFIFEAPFGSSIDPSAARSAPK
jgi:hypothetical protein